MKKKLTLLSALYLMLHLQVAAQDAVTINGQAWMKKNLDVTTYANGDPIPQVTDNAVWNKLKTGAWRYYNDDPANANYGKMYNLWAVIDPRGLAPHGWRVTGFDDWYYMMQSVPGTLVPNNGIVTWMPGLKAKGAWPASDSASDLVGFSALPGGICYGGLFYGIGEYSTWWTNTYRCNWDAPSAPILIATLHGRLCLAQPASR